MKTNIKSQANTMFRLEILGYAYGASSNIDSITTGYTYSGACVRELEELTWRAELCCE
jgi:hypothetical protein